MHALSSSERVNRFDLPSRLAPLCNFSQHQHILVGHAFIIQLCNSVYDCVAIPVECICKRKVSLENVTPVTDQWTDFRGVAR